MNIKDYLLIKLGEVDPVEAEKDIDSFNVESEAANAGVGLDPGTGMPPTGSQKINTEDETVEDLKQMPYFDATNSKYNEDQAKRNLQAESKFDEIKTKSNTDYERWKNRKAISRYLLLSALGAGIYGTRGMVTGLGSNSWKQYGTHVGLNALLGAGLGAGLTWLGNRFLPEAVWQQTHIDDIYKALDPEPHDVTHQVEDYNPEREKWRNGPPK